MRFNIYCSSQLKALSVTTSLQLPPLISYYRQAIDSIALINSSNSSLVRPSQIIPRLNQHIALHNTVDSSRLLLSQQLHQCAHTGDRL
jgi:hypothetical protein